MAKTTYIPETYYHIYNRGVGKQIEKENYLVRLSRYIHRNPVDAGLVSRPAEWVYSSYRDYVGLRQGTLPNPDVILSQFPSTKAYAAYVEEGDNDYAPVEHLLFG